MDLYPPFLMPIPHIRRRVHLKLARSSSLFLFLVTMSSQYKIPVISVKLIFNNDNNPIFIIQDEDSDSASDYEGDDATALQYLCDKMSPKHAADIISVQSQDVSYRWQKFPFKNQQSPLSYR